MTVATVSHLELAMLARAQSMSNAYRYEFEVLVKALANFYRHAFRETNCKAQRTMLIMNLRADCDQLIQGNLMHFNATA